MTSRHVGGKEREMENINNYLWRRDLLATANITLNGKPARLGGIMRDFATVWDCADIARQADYSWQAVAHVIENNGGKFRA